MEFDPNLAFNFIPIGATVSSIIVAFFIIIYKLRWRWPVNVNCWFCNCYTKIYRSELDWWQCKSCDQYNGFTKDGGYKYDIPGQRRNESTLKYYSHAPKSESLNQGRSLCKSCNRNEELKLYELRSIDPDKWRDSQIQSFRKDLDEKYPLCKKCDNFVSRVLQKQSLWLTQYKMLIFKDKPIKLLVNNSKKIEIVCRLLLMFLSLGVIYYPTHQGLSVFGALLQLTIVTQVPVSKQNFQLFLTTLWIAIGVFIPFNHTKVFEFDLKSSLLTITHITGYQIVVILSSLVGFLNLITRNSKSANLNVSFKKLNSPVINSIPKLNNKIYDDFHAEDTLIDSKPAPNNELYFSTPSPAFRTNENQYSPEKKIRHKLNKSPSKKTTKLLPHSYMSEKYSLNDSLQTLSLSLTHNGQKQMTKSPKIFEIKSYGTSSPDIFKTNFKPISRKFILAPPKLKSATQTSWVAGGYWQLGMDPPTLSRSSSQSSGFGSAGSNFGPSREPSVVNDVDKCSVISDSQCFHAQRQTSISPVNTFCPHGSTYRFTGQDYNVCPSISNSFNNQQSFCHNYHMTDQCLQKHNINCNIVQRSPELIATPTTVCPAQSQSTTILTNPSWLPALLWGSLAFNMIVFCTILLR